MSNVMFREFRNSSEKRRPMKTHCSLIYIILIYYGQVESVVIYDPRICNDLTQGHITKVKVKSLHIARICFQAISFLRLLGLG